MTERALPLLDNTPADTAQNAPKQAQALVDEQLCAATAVRGLYVHIPFCFHKCHYCDFYSVVDPADRDRQTPFTRALVRELERRQQVLSVVPDSIFFGGGTPTLLRADRWDDLLDALRQQGWLRRTGSSHTGGEQEITVEANPETVTGPLMEKLAAGGINRVSMGAQSFNERHLKTLERWHDPRKVVHAANLVREADIHNLSLDLIFAIPGQTLQDVIDDLDQALALAPTHLSVYALIFEPNTRLETRRKAGEISPVDESLEGEMYQAVIEHLKRAGFDHYEVSNYAKRDRQHDYRAQHNLMYWRNENWIAAGPGASSHLNGVRWKNQPSLARYLQADGDPPRTQIESLDIDDRRGEALMLGLRVLEGMPLNQVDALLPHGDSRHQRIAELIEIDMLERTDTHLRLTQRGLFVADSVLAELL